MRRQWKAAALLACLLAVLGVAALVGERAARQVSASDDAIALPTAMYHSVTDEGESPGQYVISPSMLERDLQYLTERGYTAVTVSDLIAYVEDGAELPEKPVMLTFDDGYYNNYCNAYPLLQQYGMCAVLSPVGTLTEQFSQTDDTEEHEVWSYCTGSELKEMADSGLIEIQNHSYNFHELSPRRGCLRMSGESESEYAQTFLRDTEQAQQLFVSLGIESPVCYTYPYGARSEETDALVEQYGFAASLSCEEGITCIVRDPACLRCIKRCNRDGRMTTEEFWSSLLEQAEEENG